jgi:hypothetical protein
LVPRCVAAEGYHVLVAGRTPEKITQVAKTICATGGSAEAITVDTTREDDVIRLFDGAMSPHNGRAAADVVIFNAGNNRRIDFKELSAEQFEEFWRIGCFGGFLVGREGRGLGRGTIIFTGASASLRGKPGFAHFAVAKAGLRMIAQSMAREYGPLGIHVAHVVIDGGSMAIGCSVGCRPWPRNVARTACLASMPSPTPIGISIVSSARHGRRRWICARSRNRSETGGLTDGRVHCAYYVVAALEQRNILRV